jgi:uncharacterized YigZ family protein
LSVSKTPSDRVRVVARAGRGELREKGSRFLARCFPATSEEDARDRVRGIAARDHDATHHCWGLRVGHGDRAVRRAQDAGEPAGTAGAPILTAVESRGLTDTLVVVSRWFGGVKLGTAGLARCYGASAGAALEDAGFVERTQESRLALEVDHADLAAVRRVVYAAGGRFTEERYDQRARVVAVLRRSLVAPSRERLMAATAGRIQFVEEDEA